jgi:carotenoid 1,2-hydratase
VGPGGYAWWYVDALSRDGRFGLTLIGFVGSVFSPYYAWSGRGRPENHCALNVALYGPPGADAWAMTERGEGAVRRDSSSLVIGESAMTWDGDGLTIRIDEITAPVPPFPGAPRPVRGVVRVRPEALNTEAFSLDSSGRHVWRPIAPRARVEATLTAPDLSWSGEGYFDTNAGLEPLEDAFETWDWSRAHLSRDTAITYDLQRREGADLSLALRFDPSGKATVVEPPAAVGLPSTIWRVPRRARADDGCRPDIQDWEDTPFYARTAVRTRLFGEAAEGVHETLSLGRLRSPWVRALLPFRMPRALR